MIDRRAIVLSGLGGLAGLPAAAASIKFNLFSVKDLVVGTPVRVDAAFAAKYRVDVPAPFEVLVPRTSGMKALMVAAPKPGNAIVKINFGTADDKLIENIQFVPMTLPLAPDKDRLAILARLLSTEGFEQGVKGALASKRLGARKIEVGGLPAVEVVGLWRSKDEGKVYLRLVGIPHPHKKEGVFAAANIIAAREEVPTVDDFQRTRGGVMLKHFKYLD